MFKTKKYPNNRKVAEAVSRFLSKLRRSSFLPLFFPNPFAEAPVTVHSHRGFSLPFSLLSVTIASDRSDCYDKNQL